MDRWKLVFACVTCLGVTGISLFGLAECPAAGQAVQEGRDATTFPRTDKTKALWEQIGRLHQQIVALELKDNAAGTASDPARSRVNERRNLTEPGQDDLRQNTADRNPAGALKTESLWMQLAQVHKQIVMKEATEGEGRTAFFRGGQQDRDRLSTLRENQQTDLAPAERAAAGASPIDPLWQQFVRLQEQIVAADVKQAEGSATDANTPARSNPESR
jgi:hypothetical protein